MIHRKKGLITLISFAIVRDGKKHVLKHFWRFKTLSTLLVSTTLQ
jgi:hypothetical protein